MYDRYAIYVTPQGALAELGAAWLGWDVARGCAVPHPLVGGLDVATITQTPRTYGMHGTVKPPFVLADGMTAQGLMDQTAQLCTTLPPVTFEALELAAMGRFLALVPVGDQSALAQVAGRVVQQLDGFRAHPSEAELARRRQANLTPAQDAHLVRWGYPYVLDQFRFHITLSAKLPKAQVAVVQDALAPLFAPHLGVPFRIDSLTLAGQRTDGMFEEIHRYALSG